MLRVDAKRIVAEGLGVSVAEAREMIRYAARVLQVTEETVRRRILKRRLSPRLVRKLAEAAGWRGKEHSTKSGKG